MGRWLVAVILLWTLAFVLMFLAGCTPPVYECYHSFYRLPTGQIVIGGKCMPEDKDTEKGDTET